MSAMDSKIKSELYSKCYQVAGTDESFAQGCDEL